MSAKSVMLFVLLILVPGFALGGERVVLATLEWPPYTGESLPEGGATSEVVREAFKVMGYDLELRFFPWNRVLEEARQDSEIAGYFPEYPDNWRRDRFLKSHSVGVSPLGLASRAGVAINWQTLEDLERYTLGTVAGYANTLEFDALVAKGRLTTDSSNSDALNLRKVLAGRVDAAVVDGNVFAYLRKADPMLRAGGGELVLHDRLLGVIDLVVCFQDTEEGEELRRVFDQGLREVDQGAIYRRHLGE
ncbi:transporter substrate-binding domain-containing protein [Pseudodesulfovibrio sp. F-1]|uniref:Transporter substrate-binding domain-containing protein n=1 Tax=Pseudodesulfovibrio alkaliphilus TaxID=2661613 RepID=A0A7K1KQB1_9BACT|nr:transporter substrate-binding domain-containing protein [Pseudodesulfovibrio alkaliphilus]MUM78072.1 transporter substrate-binding domain-containing protein [Pseudodesulfovibrio alkaliphilus]